MEITSPISCPCGCREYVWAKRFNAMTVTVEACSTIKAIDPAIVSQNFRASRIMEIQEKMSMTCEICGSDGTWCSEAVMKVGA